MKSNNQHEPLRTRRRPKAACFLATAALVLAASFAMPRTSAAAEVGLSGSGSFKPPSAEQLAALPAGLGFSQADLASGKWSFSVRYDDSIRDADPDPYVGRYAGAIRAFRVVIGSTTVDLPVDQAQIVVSDGGGGFTNRESIRLEARATIPSGLLRLSWIQVNQQPQGTDLRGPAGALGSDALPAYAMVANLATASPFDRYLELRIDAPGGGSRPLLYLSSSKLSVTASPTMAP
ncbi:hypothetical protein [Rhodoferax sediminis]|uniref:Secreted protein n=1 Tax=Rhodoferax sediminis TaxID=2509614 RepID=A0A515D7R2_9BURK|nr:hypothetical protein [Rhodoferax sediminis]QDL36453.1 hypothetical protein EUB48_03430 [Rhodoferax sediminis]